MESREPSTTEAAPVGRVGSNTLDALKMLDTVESTMGSSMLHLHGIGRALEVSTNDACNLPPDPRNVLRIIAMSRSAMPGCNDDCITKCTDPERCYGGTEGEAVPTALDRHNLLRKQQDWVAACASVATCPASVNPASAATGPQQACGTEAATDKELQQSASEVNPVWFLSDSTPVAVRAISMWMMRTLRERLNGKREVGAVKSAQLVNTLMWEVDDDALMIMLYCPHFTKAPAPLTALHDLTLRLNDQLRQCFLATPRSLLRTAIRAHGQDTLPAEFTPPVCAALARAALDYLHMLSTAAVLDVERLGEDAAKIAALEKELATEWTAEYDARVARRKAEKAKRRGEKGSGKHGAPCTVQKAAALLFGGKAVGIQSPGVASPEQPSSDDDGASAPPPMCDAGPCTEPCTQPSAATEVCPSPKRQVPQEPENPCMAHLKAELAPSADYCEVGGTCYTSSAVNEGGFEVLSAEVTCADHMQVQRETEAAIKATADCISHVTKTQGPEAAQRHLEGLCNAEPVPVVNTTVEECMDRLKSEAGKLAGKVGKGGKPSKRCATQAQIAMRAKYEAARRVLPKEGSAHFLAVETMRRVVVDAKRFIGVFFSVVHRALGMRQCPTRMDPALRNCLLVFFNSITDAAVAVDRLTRLFTRWKQSGVDCGVPYPAFRGIPKSVLAEFKERAQGIRATLDTVSLKDFLAAAHKTGGGASPSPAPAANKPEEYTAEEMAYEVAQETKERALRKEMADVSVAVGVAKLKDPKTAAAPPSAGPSSGVHSTSMRVSDASVASGESGSPAGSEASRFAASSAFVVDNDGFIDGMLTDEEEELAAAEGQAAAGGDELETPVAATTGSDHATAKSFDDESADLSGDDGEWFIDLTAGSPASGGSLTHTGAANLSLDSAKASEFVDLSASQLSSTATGSTAGQSRREAQEAHDRNKDRFSVHRSQVLGRGAYGTVFRGFDNDRGIPVAVKEVQLDVGGDGQSSIAAQQGTPGPGSPGSGFGVGSAAANAAAATASVVGPQMQEMVRQVTAEFRLLQQLDCASIVKVVSASLDLRHGRGRLVLEWMPGGSLASVLKQTGRPFRDSAVRRYVRQLLEAVAYLHDRHLVHRDIKPANLLLSSDGNVKLSDFGTSREGGFLTGSQVLPDGQVRLDGSGDANANGRGSVARGSFRTGTVVGTVPYLAPEAFSGRYSKATDIWAVGCTALELMTGAMPWSERGITDHIALIFAIGSAAPPNHHPRLPTDADAAARDFFRHCFGKNPEERATAKELLQHPWLTQA